jgi:hypothetical protein
MQVHQEVLEQAFEHLRRCGGGRRECIVYLTAPLDKPTTIDGLIHPRHSASMGGYEVDTDAIAELSSGLLASRRTVRAQMHTHPGSAYHSSCDDAFALVGTPGFLSLVIPNFACGTPGLEGAFLAERGEDGDWMPVAPGDRLEIVS